MDYIKISKKLENLGYSTQFHKIINSLSVGIPENDNFKLDSTFRIGIINNKIKLDYFNAQIPVEKEFEKVDELIDFIKDKFPIN